jgi:hypothetical protein
MMFERTGVGMGLALILAAIAATVGCTETKPTPDERKRDPVVVLDDWNRVF